PVWTPPLAATPTQPADKLPPEAPGAGPAAPEATPEKKIAGNAAVQQDTQPAGSLVVTPASVPSRSDLLSTLANRQDQPVTLTTDEAAGVEMTREWRDRAKDFESQNTTDG